mmetsp:Transcript_94304/g.236748  ORF Transcript_94304/g.236748 Transcript_94304/m.236748 type:complete len:317 (-) Transcript_94304:504-1454(-)
MLSGHHIRIWPCTTRRQLINEGLLVACSRRLSDAAIWDRLVEDGFDLGTPLAPDPLLGWHANRTEPRAVEGNGRALGSAERHCLLGCPQARLVRAICITKTRGARGLPCEEEPVRHGLRQEVHAQRICSDGWRVVATSHELVLPMFCPPNFSWRRHVDAREDGPQLLHEDTNDLLVRYKLQRICEISSRSCHKHWRNCLVQQVMQVVPLGGCALEAGPLALLHGPQCVLGGTCCLPPRSVELEGDLLQQPHAHAVNGALLPGRQRRLETDRGGLQDTHRDGNDRECPLVHLPAPPVHSNSSVAVLHEADRFIEYDI